MNRDDSVIDGILGSNSEGNNTTTFGTFISSDSTDFNYHVLVQIKMLRTILQDKGSVYTQTEINRLLDQLVSHVDLATVQIGCKLYPHFV
jgi:hypothetical protein